MIYSNQAVSGIGSVGRGRNGGGGSGRGSINIYIQCVKIKKGVFVTAGCRRSFCWHC